ncbi:ABC transporter substrate-binding protein [Zavarzinia compransoris]|uniref:ABC transporter substrate-binding protein n=1 Tax=Zavarzinia marina TaxID=2911065 RepID=UPI001F1E70D6|nr:ABC transporter substrate-binding protein [Zavarzinia marina]MCF4165152.1 ABC transporter substrate-binding protein [Zavarzinia marina]
MFKKALLAGVAASALITGTAMAEGLSGDKVVVGVLTDLSGVYADIAGKGSIAAAEMAVADYGGTVLGKPIEILSADHQNKPDIASTIAREWIDAQGADVIVDLVTSSVGLAVQGIGGEKGVVTINSGAATVRLTQKECTATGFHWIYDTYSLAHVTSPAVIAEGGDSWYIITADYAFGHSLEADAASVIAEKGATLVGTVRHPFPSADLSSYLLQAQASGAKVIGFANAGQDTINSVKQASEFGIVAGGQKLVALLAFLSDIHSIGLELGQGLNVTTGFYWNMDDETRAFAERFNEKVGRMPTMVQASVYSSTLHYLKAVEAAGTDDGATVAAKMKEMPVKDAVVHDGTIAANGRMIHDMYLMEVKKPEESTGEWDVYKLVRTVPGAEAFQDPKESGCALVE